MAWWANLQIVRSKGKRALGGDPASGGPSEQDRNETTQPQVDPADDPEASGKDCQPMTSFRQLRPTDATPSEAPVPALRRANAGRGEMPSGMAVRRNRGRNRRGYRGLQRVRAACIRLDAQTAVERELVLRLASLLWRLRRATSIETDLLRIQAEILRDRREQTRSRAAATSFRLSKRDPLRDQSADGCNDREFRRATIKLLLPFPSARRETYTTNLAHCFQRLTNLNDGVFERLGRYETTLWRQMVQIHLLLQSARRR